MKSELIDEIIKADEMASRCFRAAGEESDVAKIERLMALGREAANRALRLRSQFNGVQDVTI